MDKFGYRVNTGVQNSCDSMPELMVPLSQVLRNCVAATPDGRLIRDDTYGQFSDKTTKKKGG